MKIYDNRRFPTPLSALPPMSMTAGTPRDELRGAGSFLAFWPARALAVFLAIVAAAAAISCSAAPANPPDARTDLTDRGVGEVLSPPAPAQPEEEVLGARGLASEAAEAPTSVPALDFQKVKPNELGTIPILEYHIIADAEEDQWVRTPAHLREDLQKLYDAGFRPIALNDFLDNRIDVPAGLSPVVLTFDDSSPGQFRFLQRDGQVVVDPNSAVGILEEFHASHPDFPLRATFFVLPEADQPHKLFGQPEYETQKLRYLVEHGMEIGNHTYWHQRLDIVDDDEARRQLALAVKSIQQAVPGYQVRAMALPQGMWPENRALGLSGSFEGTTYHNDAILEVGSDPAPSPNSKDYDPHSVPRVQVFADNLDRWLNYLARNLDERYVSDGDPDTITYPQRLESHLNPASLGTRQVRSY